MYFIGYDVGTTSVKATLLDGLRNKAVCSAQHPKIEMEIIAHHPGWAEQHPEEWWNSTIEVTKELIAGSGIDPSEIKAIGISYQMHGLVIVDKNLEVLRPSIIWCDSRAVSVGEKAYKELGPQYCQDYLLNSPGNFTASKLAWVRQNEPSTYEKVYKAMLPGDFIALKMSGQAQTTYSGLSEGIYFDFIKNDISEQLLNCLEIGRELIPDIVPTFGEQTRLSQSAAQILGLSSGTPITYRAGDQPNNALSLNVLHPGELAATAGTSGVIYGISDLLKNDPLSRVNAFAHVNHSEEIKRIGILLCINGTGILNSWTRKNLGNLSYEEMNQLALSTDIGANGLSILPFGNGAERILKNKNIGAQIHGLQFNSHHKGHVFRAVQEGIACSMKYGTDLLKSLDLKPTKIRAGKANLFLSKLFQKAIANLTGASIELFDTDGSEGAARGAGIGSGYYNQKTAFEGLHLIERIDPDPQEQMKYQDVFERWNTCLIKSLDNQPV